MKYRRGRISSVTTLRVLISAVLMVFLVTGCASKQAPEQQFYTLQSVASSEEVFEGSVGLANAKLRIAEVSTAAYLSQTGIVTADSAGLIYPANYHLWAELPEVAIKRRLERCVLQDTNSERKSQLIHIKVHSFQGDGNGGVVFGGVWTSTPQGKRVVKDTYMYEYRERQNNDGYSSLVAALSQAVHKLCGDILDNA